MKGFNFFNRKKEYKFLNAFSSLRNVDNLDERDVLKRSLNKPHYSLDSEIEKNPMKIPKLYSDFYTTPNLYSENLTDYTLFDQQKRDVLHKAENQFRSLMISSSGGVGGGSGSGVGGVTSGTNQDFHNLKFSKVDLNPKRQSDEMVDSRSSRVYDLERAAKNYFNESKRYAALLLNLIQFLIFFSFLSYEELKAPVRRVDSGPAGTQQRKDMTGSFDVVLDSMQQPNMLPLHITRVSTSALNQGLPPNKQPSRRDMVCRSTGDDLNASYHNYQNYSIPSSQQQSNYADNSSKLNINQSNAYKIQSAVQPENFSTPKGIYNQKRQLKYLTIYIYFR